MKEFENDNRNPPSPHVLLLPDAAGCPIVVVLNKWELLDAEQRGDVDDAVERKLHFIGEAPVLKMSALTGKGVHRLLPVLEDTVSDYHRRIPTRDVNKVIRAAQQSQPAPHGCSGPVRDPGSDRPADLHDVREPHASRPRICVISSDRCGRRSTSARCRSRSGCAVVPNDRCETWVPVRLTVAAARPARPGR